MNKDKVLLVFPDGVGIRNYLYSELFHNAGELVLYHNFTPETIAYLNGIQHLDAEHQIPVYRESFSEKYLRELISLTRLQHNAKLTRNDTILHNWNTTHTGFFKKVFYKSIEVASRFVGKYEQILALEVKYQRAIRQNTFYAEVKAFLQRTNPTSVFCSHQRGLKMATIFAAAGDLGIPTTTVIYSWDNLPKARLALKADIYAVWSQYMKDELQMYYPEISDSHIQITGTPQFNFYNDPANIIDKATFYERYGLDSNKKIICFSGDDVRTSPDDPQYLDDVASAIVAAGVAHQYQILFRRCPVDFSGRYDSVIAKHNGLIRAAPPAWNSSALGRWYDVFPLYDDIALLVSTCYYSDVVINIGSTMAFDFAMFDKPCLFINYDQEVKSNREWSVEHIYNFQHFKSLQGLEPVGWINSQRDILSLISKACQTPKNVGPDRLKWMNKVVGNTSANSKMLAVAQLNKQ